MKTIYMPDFNPVTVQLFYFCAEMQLPLKARKIEEHFGILTPGQDIQRSWAMTVCNWLLQFQPHHS